MLILKLYFAKKVIKRERERERARVREKQTEVVSEMVLSHILYVGSEFDD